MRIRTLALGYMTGLGLLAFAAALTVWNESWTRLNEVRETETMLHMLQPAVRFVERFALERGVYNQVLVSRETGLEAKRKIVQAEVARTEALFDETLSRLSGSSSPVALRLSNAVMDARAIIHSARAEADPVWQDGTRTSPEAAALLVVRFSKAGSVIDDGVAQAVRRVSAHDAGIGLMLEISRLSNDIRELAGQRGTLLSRYLASLQPFTVSDNVRVSELSGGLSVTWLRLQRISSLVGSPNIEQAVDSVRREFFGKAEPVYLKMADSARDGTYPPFDFLAYRQWTVAALGYTLAARDVPIEQALGLVVAQRGEAIQSFILSLLGLGAVLGFVIISGWAIESRVVRPVSRMTQSLDHLSEGSPNSAGAAEDARAFSTLYGQRGDEIGSLARALSRLHTHTVDLERLYMRFNAVLANLPQGVCFYDAEGTLVVSNRRYAELYAVDPRALRAGLTLPQVLEQRAIAGTAVALDGDTYVRSALPKVGPEKIVTCVVELPNGHILSVQGTAVPGGGWLTTHLDITEQTLAEAQIAHMASHDSLTGLPNRNLFQRELDRGLRRTLRSGKLAVLCLDLDRFKWVNDTLGHSAGDDLLKQVAQRLKSCVRETDLVARLGGDEFAIILDDPVDENGVTVLCQRMIELVSQTYELEGHQAVIGTSIGIALAPQDGHELEDIMKAGDMALYRAKSDGRGTWRFFEREMDAKMQLRRNLEMDLRQALAGGEFELHYQPIFNLAANEISGLEALLRWNHPTRGRVSPADFIPIAEETGLIVEIGAWVMRQACLEAMTWPRPVKVAVNLSPRQFSHNRLLSDVMGALRDAGLPAQRLKLEITEQVLLGNTESTVRTLHHLRQLGVRIAMDDFGTGYSSLSYLRRFPFDKIKIDQSFVRDLCAGSEAVAIVRAVIDLAAGLNMTTTAEGVETPEQLAQLRALGCNEVQGYLLSRPMPAHEVGPVLHRGLSLDVAA